MNAEQIRRRVSDIDAMRSDDERAHAAEDKLHSDVLHAIANGAANPSVLASAAVETEEISFARWYG